MRYRTKPEYIDAEPYTTGTEDGYKIMYCNKDAPGVLYDKKTEWSDTEIKVPYINTIYGTELINKSDYVVNLPSGERIIIHARELEQKYERCDE